MGPFLEKLPIPRRVEDGAIFHLFSMERTPYHFTPEIKHPFPFSANYLNPQVIV
jgi:hypothetical protein